MPRRNRVPESVSMETPKARKAEERRRREIVAEDRPSVSARDPNRPVARRVSLPEALVSKLPTGASRDAARMALHGLARTGNTILRAIDIPNRVFGNTRSVLQDIYERSEANLARDAYEDRSGVPQVGEAAVHLASAGVLGRALPAVFGANVGADTYETAKYAGASEGEAIVKGLGHGVVDTAIWTLGQGLASKYLPKAWQWLGREIIGAGRGAASSVTSDAMLNSLGADISGEEMAKRAVHAAWMVPLLGMLKMGGKRREEAMSLLRKARPDLAGERADKVIETIENEFSDPKSQKVALAWVARKGANLPDDTAQIRQALEVSSKVKGLDPMSKSPIEILSDPVYARYLPKPKPQDVKAFSNMKRYPMGVIGFDVSDDAAGRQATREMINAYMSPSSNPWCLATGKDAAKLGELGPEAENYWRGHSAVPKQIFFQEVDGKLELTAFRATSPGGEGRQEYWDTSDAGYSGIPIKVKVPGDPMGRYRKMVFRPKGTTQVYRSEHELEQGAARGDFPAERLDQYRTAMLRNSERTGDFRLEIRGEGVSDKGEVQGTFKDIAPGKIFKGDPFRDGRSQTWARPIGGTSDGWTKLRDLDTVEKAIRDGDSYDDLRRWYSGLLGRYGISGDHSLQEVRDTIANTLPGKGEYILMEDKVRTTENGITKFRTTKYADPTARNYEPPKPGEAPKPVEIEESELVSPEWMRSHGYDPENEADVRRMNQDLDIQTYGNGVEAAMAVVPTKRTYMQTKSGTPETVTYGPNGRDVVSVDFTKDGVPYREEYFQSGPENADPSYVYRTIDPDEFPHPVALYPLTMETPFPGFRLARNPDSESPEVLNEIKWDDGLEGFVRTSGSRRWYVPREEAEKVARAKDYYFDPQDEPEAPIVSVSIEDRQPDGTWAPAGDVELLPAGERMPGTPDGTRPSISAEEGRVTLRDLLDDDSDPFALKAGRTRRDIRAAEGGGDAGPAEDESIPEPGGASVSSPAGVGPRIVINPSTFRNEKDALCVAFNEAFRLVMEEMGFNPVAEPTDAQRKFFSDTAYRDDELQLRRTILARICTFDTSVKDPTDEQIQEAQEFLENVLEAGFPQNEWEQQAVMRLRDVISHVSARGVRGGETPEPPSDEGTVQGAVGGGDTMRDKVLHFLSANASANDNPERPNPYAAQYEAENPHRGASMLGGTLPVAAGVAGAESAAVSAGAGLLGTIAAGTGGAVAGLALGAPFIYDMANPAVNDLTSRELLRDYIRLTDSPGYTIAAETLGSDGTVGYSDVVQDNYSGNIRLIDPFDAGPIGYRKAQIGSILSLLAGKKLKDVGRLTNGGGNLGENFAKSLGHMTEGRVPPGVLAFNPDGKVRDEKGVRRPASYVDVLARALESKEERALREKVDSEAVKLYGERTGLKGRFDPERLQKAFVEAASKEYWDLVDSGRLGDWYYNRTGRSLEYDLGVPVPGQGPRDIAERRRQGLEKALQAEFGGSVKVPLDRVKGPAPQWFLDNYRWKVPEEYLSRGRRPDVAGLETEIGETARKAGKSVPEWLHTALDALDQKVAGVLDPMLPDDVKQFLARAAGSGGNGLSMKTERLGPGNGPQGTPGQGRGAGTPARPSRDPLDRGRAGGKARRPAEPVPGSLRKGAIKATQGAVDAGDAGSFDMYRAFYGDDAARIVADALFARGAARGDRPAELEGKHPDGVPIDAQGTWQWDFNDVWTDDPGLQRPFSTRGRYDTAVTQPSGRAYARLPDPKDGRADNPVVVLPAGSFEKFLENPTGRGHDIVRHELAHPGNRVDLTTGPSGEEFRRLLDNAPYLGPGVYGPGGVRLFNYHWSQPDEFTAALANVRRTMAIRGENLRLDSDGFDRFIVDKYGDLLANKRYPHITVPTDEEAGQTAFSRRHREIAGFYQPATDLFRLSGAVNARSDELGLTDDAKDLIEQYILIRELDPEGTVRELRESPAVRAKYGDRLEPLIRAFGTREERRQVWNRMRDILRKVGPQVVQAAPEGGRVRRVRA